MLLEDSWFPKEKVQQFCFKITLPTYYPSLRNVFSLTSECDKLKEKVHSLGIWQCFHWSCCAGVVMEDHEVRCSFKFYHVSATLQSLEGPRLSFYKLRLSVHQIVHVLQMSRAIT